MKGERLFKHIISGQFEGAVGAMLRTGLGKASTVYETVVE